MSDDSSLVTRVVSAEAFFAELVEKSVRKQDVGASAKSIAYVSGLLAHRLFHEDGKRYFENTLVALRLEALEKSGTHRLTQEIGDTALVVAGYFYQRLIRYGISEGYYISVGQSAYASLADAMHAQVYREMAELFPRFVRALNDVADETLPHTPQNLVNAYTSWLETDNSQLERLLAKQGIVLTRTRGNG